jgi:flagellar hook-basal body complex protein FliE
MNDLRLAPFSFEQAVARAGLRTDGHPRVAPGEAGAPAGGFSAAMAEALQAVSRQQTEASGLQRELMLGNPAVSVEQTMMAMTKAQIGFQATLQVRNRLAQAYSEIMNMQV